MNLVPVSSASGSAYSSANSSGVTGSSSQLFVVLLYLRLMPAAARHAVYHSSLSSCSAALNAATSSTDSTPSKYSCMRYPVATVGVNFMVAEPSPLLTSVRSSISYRPVPSALPSLVMSSLVYGRVLPYWSFILSVACTWLPATLYGVRIVSEQDGEWMAAGHTVIGGTPPMMSPLMRMVMFQTPETVGS